LQRERGHRGGNLNTARSELAGAGIKSSAIAIAGSVPGPSASAETYNGSSWTTVGSLNTARRLLGASGTSNSSALAFGGYTTVNVTVTELWDGSAWTEVNDLNSARRYASGIIQGTTSATLTVGGRNPGGAPMAETESWNGTSWTEVNDLNTARFGVMATGTQTAALAAGGDSDLTNTESWNGTSWTEVNDINSTRYGGGRSGSQTDALIFGGNGPVTQSAATEYWNGTSWTEVNDIATATGEVGSGGSSSSSAIIFGGNTGSITAATEEWTTTPAPTFQQENLGQVFYNSTADAFKVTQQSVPAGTWASGGNLNTARRQQGSFGTYNDGVIVNTPAFGGNTEIYNGTAWTEVNDVPAGATSLGGSGNTSASGAVFFGYNTATSVTSATYEFDGTNWTAGSSANTARAAGGGTGSSANDAIYVGGVNAAAPQTYFTNVETYNGTAWTETTDISGNRQLQALVGTSTSALMIGGSPSSNTHTNTNLEWNSLDKYRSFTN
jgi:hypothetical protein